jgi:phospholipase C
MIANPRSLCVAAGAILGLGASLLSGCGAKNTTPPVTPIASLAQQKIKHVFILIQENHSFDNYFGLYPGTGGQAVENLGSAAAQQDDCVPDPQTGGCQAPFLISANTSSPNYVPDAPDIDGGNNDRDDQEAAIDHGKMDGWLADAEGPSPAPLGATPSPAQIEAHNDAISIEAVYDCDTIPYLWDYAKNFALFDHYFQANTGQSTPGNIQLFSGQIGQTEAAAGKAPIAMPVAGGGYSDGVPISNDDNPPNSAFASMTAYTGDAAQSQSYATMPVLLNPGMDQAAQTSGVTGLIPDDIALEAKAARPSTPWGWYEEGLFTANAGLSAHHTAPLYFDYINNAKSAYVNASTLRDNTPANGLISDIQNAKLPSSGVFWVKGGKVTQYGFKAADSTIAADFTGDDDHPGQADHQVAEAYLATEINAIANSQYWKDSVIIVTWDDDGGMYDHAPPPSYGSTCPQDATGPEAGYACGNGVRLPLLVISPFAKTGTVVHDQTDGGSISKFVEAIFGLPAFGSLPDEATGVSQGLGPADGNPATSNLFDALDPAKLSGSGIAGSAATIPSPAVPPAMTCASLGLTPIAAPASLPSGFETLGYYESPAGMAATRLPRVRPARRDGRD